MSLTPGTAPASPPEPQDPAPEVLRQLSSLTLERHRPLIISDADEVLFAFMAGFERYLEEEGFYFDWRTYALAGNIRHRCSEEPLDAAEVPPLLARFFAARTEALDPVPGAAEALASLTRRGAQVIVLSNLPMSQVPARRRALAAHGMDYPLIANSGAKGPAVRHLASQVQAPVVFIDDIPRHHRSVRQAAAETFCLHFVADPRLARLLGPAPECDCRADRWPEALAAVLTCLAHHGF